MVGGVWCSHFRAPVPLATRALRCSTSGQDFALLLGSEALTPGFSRKFLDALTEKTTLKPAEKLDIFLQSDDLAKSSH